MYTNIILIIINLIILFKKDFKFNKHLNLFNLMTVVFNATTISITYIDKQTIMEYFIYSSIFHLIISLINYKLKKQIKYNLKTVDKISLLAIFSIVLIERVGESEYLALILIVSLLLVILTEIFYIIRLLYINRKLLCFYPNKEDQLVDVKFTMKLELNKLINHFIYWALFIVFLNIEFAYIEYLYIIVFFLFIKYLYKNYGLIIKVLKDTNNRVIYQKEYPTKILSFHTIKETLRLRGILYFMLFYSVTIVLYYMNYGIFISVPLYLLFLYVVLQNKVYLIRHIYSINPKLIKSNNYKLRKNIKIKDYDKFDFLEIVFYKVKYKDYISTWIIFDPDLVIEEVSIRVDKNNEKDYIIDLSEYLM